MTASSSPATSSGRSLAGAIGPHAEVKSAAVDDRFTFDSLKTFISIIRTILLVFAGVAVLVGGFTIFNSLSITVAQRTKEFGLLRMVGATRRQVRRGVLLEALASAASERWGSAWVSRSALGLNEMFAAVGLDLPRIGTRARHPYDGRSLLVGTLATVAAAMIPARRATKIAPVAALRDASQASAGRALRSARAWHGLRRRPTGRVGRRRRRRACPPQRDAQPGPDGFHRIGADDRRRAGDRGDRGRQGP